MKANFILLFVLISFVSAAQYKELGGGYRIENSEETFSMIARTRIQPRWDVMYNGSDSSLTNMAKIARARLKFDGYFYNRNLRYKIEYDVVNGYVRDAVIKYRMGNFDIWFGQTKLPSNHERLVSSANLQLTNRSIFNNAFTLDRDIGFQLHHKFNVGNMIIRDKYALTAGNGILNKKYNSGVSSTGKIEILPFGSFKKKGEYITSDIYKEQSVKIIATAYINYNTNAYKSMGQVGVDLNSESDLVLVGFDFLLKYKGLSALIEAAHRSVSEGDVVVYDNLNNYKGSYYTGWGINIQSGYLFDNMWEISGRYSMVNPDNLAQYHDAEDYTLGISKYVVGNSLKIQADITLRKEFSKKDAIIASLLMELQF